MGEHKRIRTASLQSSMIERNVIANHSLCREPLFKAAANGTPVEFQRAGEYRNRRIGIVDDIAGDAIIDDFSHGAAPKPNYRRTVCHCLDHD